MEREGDEPLEVGGEQDQQPSANNVNNVDDEAETAEKILVLLSEIGTDSNQMMEHCEKFEPWLWGTQQTTAGKLITV